MTTLAATAMPALNPGRRALLLLIVLSLLPIAIGGSLYWFGWRPDKTGNHGELVQPPQPAPVATLGDEAKGRWLLVVAGQSSCDAPCIALAERARSIQVSLAKEMGRMRRVVVTGNASPALDALKSRQPDLMIAGDPAWQTLAGSGSAPQLLLVDPAGNLMMRYAPDTEAKGIRADLERLLKYSWIG